MEIEKNEQNNVEIKSETLMEQHHTHLGPLLGLLLIVLVIILGGLYLWGASLDQQVASETSTREIVNNEPETPRSNADAQILRTVSPSDSLEAIETDLESTDLDSLDSEISEMERELLSGISN